MDSGCSWPISVLPFGAEHRFREAVDRNFLFTTYSVYARNIHSFRIDAFSGGLDGLIGLIHRDNFWQLYLGLGVGIASALPVDGDPVYVSSADSAGFIHTSVFEARNVGTSFTPRFLYSVEVQPAEGHFVSFGMGIQKGKDHIVKLFVNDAANQNPAYQDEDWVSWRGTYFTINLEYHYTLHFKRKAVDPL